MAKKICQHCGKGILRGNKVSHSKQRSKKISLPNLHWVKIIKNNIKKRMLLCSKCIKLLKKQTVE